MWCLHVFMCTPRNSSMITMILASCRLKSPTIQLFGIGLMHGNKKNTLTHWGRVTHICVSDLTSIGSDNGLSPGRRQAIIRTNAGILLIRPLGTNFSEFSVEILMFSFKKIRLKVSSAKRRPFCLVLDELKLCVTFCEGNSPVTDEYPSENLWCEIRPWRMTSSSNIVQWSWVMFVH